MNSHSLSNTLETLIGSTSATQHFDNFGDWKAYFSDLSHQQQEPGLQAIQAGYESDCIGYAFMAGYQGALRTLVPTLGHHQLSAFCVTEENGNHPRAIETTLHQQGQIATLAGNKKFITGGQYADTLLVVAKLPEEKDGRPILKLVKVDRNMSGIKVLPMPKLAFVPEIEHARVELTNVNCTEDNILAGDGYSDYVKPFRTIEDTFVSLALSSYLLKISLKENLSHPISEQLMSIVLTHYALSQQPPSQPATHAALSGARAQFEHLLQHMEEDWATGNSTAYQHWQRDKAILGVAKAARDKRSETAWQRMLTK